MTIEEVKSRVDAISNGVVRASRSTTQSDAITNHILMGIMETIGLLTAVLAETNNGSPNHS